MAQDSRLDRYDLLILLALVLPVLVVFSDPVFTGRVFYYRDIARFFHPNYHYVVERLGQGELPLWNPYTLCGQPFFGSWYPGALYPLTWLMLIVPLPHGLTLFVLLHSYLALITMYVLVRSLGCGRAASAVGALTFGLSGYALSVVDFPNTLAGLAWAPLVLMLVRRSLCRPSVGRAAAAALVIAVQILAGGPEMVCCTWLVVGLFGLVKIVSDRRSEEGRRLWRSRLAVLVGCFALGALLAAVQLVPFAEVLAHSSRAGGYGVTGGGAAAVPPAGLARFVVPDLMASTDQYNGLKWDAHQKWLKSFYLGLVPLVLAGVALVQVRQRRTYFLAGLAAGGMLLACGSWTLFWDLAYYTLPGIAATRYPVKLMMIPTLAIALLAGLGANWLISADAARRRRALIGMIVALLLVQSGVAIGIRFTDRALEDRAAQPEPARGDGDRAPADDLQNTRASLVRTGILMAVMGVVLIGAAAASRPGGTGRTWLLGTSAAALGLILVADTMHHHRPQVMTASARIYQTRSASLEQIEALPQPSRIFVEPSTWAWLDKATLAATEGGDPLLYAREVHALNLPLRHGVQSVNGFPVIMPRRAAMLYGRFMRRYDPRELPLIDFLNARLLIRSDNLEGRASLDAIRFDPNPEAFARATIIRGRPSRSFANDDAVVGWLVNRSVDLRREVHLERTPEPTPARNQRPAARDRVEVVRYEPERIVMDVESTAPGFLVVSDQYFPGWRASVDGRPAEIVPANLCFRAVAIPAGTFRVEMTYRPWTVVVGAVLSAVGAILVGVLAVASKVSGTLTKGS